MLTKGYANSDGVIPSQQNTQEDCKLSETVRENIEANSKSRVLKDNLRSAAGLLRKLQSHQQLAFRGCSLNEWCRNKYCEERQAAGPKDT